MQNFKKIFISGIVWKFVFYVSSFCLNLLLANILGATGSGSFFYLLNNLSIVLLFLSFGLDSAITYTHAKKEFGSGHLLLFSITWSFLSTLLFTALMCAVAFTQLVEWNSHTLYIVLYVFSSILIALISAIFYASNNHIIPNLLPSITNLLLILYLLFYPYKEEQQVYETLVKAFLVAGIFTGLIFLIYANNKIRIISFKGLLNRKLLSYSWQFFVANIFVALLLRSDIWLIKHLCTYADLGNY